MSHRTYIHIYLSIYPETDKLFFQNNGEEIITNTMRMYTMKARVQWFFKCIFAYLYYLRDLFVNNISSEKEYIIIFQTLKTSNL